MQLELLNVTSGPVKATSNYDGANRMVRGHGRYQDSLLRNNVFEVSDTAGKTIPSGLSTAPTTVTLFNPIGSGVFCSILYAAVNLSVIGAPIGVVWIGVTPPSPTAVTYTGTNLIASSKGGVSGSRVFPCSGTIALPSTPTILGELGVYATGAVTLLPLFPALYKWFDGAIGVGPGGTLSFQASQVGGTSGAWGTWLWEEIPIAPGI